MTPKDSAFGTDRFPRDSGFGMDRFQGVPDVPEPSFFPQTTGMHVRDRTLDKCSRYFISSAGRAFLSGAQSTGIQLSGQDCQQGGRTVMFSNR